jgi:hypothetical protein
MTATLVLEVIDYALFRVHLAGGEKFLAHLTMLFNLLPRLNVIRSVNLSSWAWVTIPA